MAAVSDLDASFDRIISAIAARQHGVVATRQLLGRGIPRGALTTRVQAGRLFPVHTGVYAVGHPSLSRDGAWMGAVLAAGPEGLLSHRAALNAWELSEIRAKLIDVTLPGIGSRRRPGLFVHRTRWLDPADRTSIRGIPVTSVERTLVDVSGLVSPGLLREAFNEAGRRGILDPVELVRNIEQRRGKRGIGDIRRLAAGQYPEAFRTRSELEVDFLAFCAEYGIPQPLVNHKVHGFEVDAYWPDEGLVVELDSWRFHSDRDSFERDRERIAELSMHGIEVLPLTHRRLRGSPRRCADIILSALRRRAAQPRRIYAA